MLLGTTSLPPQGMPRTRDNANPRVRFRLSMNGQFPAWPAATIGQGLLPFSR